MRGFYLKGIFEISHKLSIYTLKDMILYDVEILGTLTLKRPSNPL